MPYRPCCHHRNILKPTNIPTVSMRHKQTCRQKAGIHTYRSSRAAVRGIAVDNIRKITPTPARRHVEASLYFRVLHNTDRMTSRYTLCTHSSTDTSSVPVQPLHGISTAVRPLKSAVFSFLQTRRQRAASQHRRGGGVFLQRHAEKA